MSYEQTEIDVVTQEYLHKILDYNPETGMFTWKVNLGRLAKKGFVAGSIDSWGYRQICIKGKKRLAHRLAWLYVYGEHPKQQIDHIDCDKLNNAISNLRDVDQFVNQHNRKAARKDSSTNLIGAIKDHDKYRAQIRINNNSVFLGTFDTAIEAHNAYKKAKIELHGIQI